ncbi:hypothetical protein [Thalassotalea sediminis]|uniref:hypothetical protein n=1 Tax=Thalassotalea sediminis TaxID=1759089 RepID=UPI002573D17D|nr:hypothetical protein [Thalassotalea sediminis]
MKKLVLGFSLLLTATAANAISDNAKFVGVDKSLETSLCVTAVTKGFSAAYQEALTVSKTYAQTLHMNSCNGVSIKQFASPAINTVKTKVVKIVPADQSAESKLCVLAAQEGYKALLKKHNKALERIVCNGKEIKSFAKQRAGI